MRLRILILSVPLLMTAGCSKLFCDSGECDTGDPADDIRITGVTWDCNQSEYWFEVETTGEPSGGDLFITQNTNPSWDEDHPLSVQGSSAQGSTLGVTLSHVGSSSEVVAGSTTFYTCDNGFYMENTLRFMAVALYQGVEADCVIWGNDPQEMDGAGACREIDAVWQ